MTSLYEEKGKTHDLGHTYNNRNGFHQGDSNQAVQVFATTKVHDAAASLVKDTGLNMKLQQLTHVIATWNNPAF